MKKLGLLFAIVFVQLTGIAQTSIRMTVKEECVTCRRMMEQTCYQIQKNGSKTWELFYDRIDGFMYEPGYRYEILVIETPRPEPIPQDLSASTYKLDKIISKTLVPANGKGYKWQVIEMNGKNIEATPITFSYIDSTKMIQGNAGCNGFGLSAKMHCKNSRVKTGTSVGTMMACGPEIMASETEFLKLITSKKFKLSQDANGLWNWKSKGKTVFKMKPVIVPAEPEDVNTGKNKPAREADAWNYFSGKTFKLIQMNGEVKYKTGIELIFNTENMTLNGSTGCNKTSGAFSYENRMITFSGIATTKMACTDEQRSADERDFLAILRQEGLKYDFAERVLNIYDMKGKLVLMFASDIK